MKVNQNIREAAKHNGVKLWQIAAHLGISEPTITRWLRTPLPPEKEKKIMDAIEEIAKGVAYLVAGEDYNAWGSGHGDPPMLNCFYHSGFRKIVSEHNYQVTVAFQQIAVIIPLAVEIPGGEPVGGKELFG